MFLYLSGSGWDWWVVRWEDEFQSVYVYIYVQAYNCRPL